MSNLQENYVNPFDNEQLDFTVLKNQKGEYSLWPQIHEVPTGWEVQFGPSNRAACIEYVQSYWTSIQPFAQA